VRVRVYKVRCVDTLGTRDLTHDVTTHHMTHDTSRDTAHDTAHDTARDTFSQATANLEQRRLKEDWKKIARMFQPNTNYAHPFFYKKNSHSSTGTTTIGRILPACSSLTRTGVTTSRAGTMKAVSAITVLLSWNSPTGYVWCVCACLCVRVCVFVCMSVCVCVCIYIYSRLQHSTLPAAQPSPRLNPPRVLRQARF